MEANSNPPKRRFQFTLLNLLLLMTMVAFGFGLYRARLNNLILDAKNQELSVRNQSLLDNIKQLRAERGGLTVEDETKVYAIRVPEIRKNIWTYRIFLPEGDNYFVATIANNLPTGEYGPLMIEGERPPNGKGMGAFLLGKSEGSAIGIRPGEYLITYAFFMEESWWKYRLQIKRVSEGKNDNASISGGIPHKPNEWPASKDYSQSSTGGVNERQQEIDLKSSHVLLDYRPFKSGNAKSSTCGAIVWVDRVSNYDD